MKGTGEQLYIGKTFLGEAKVRKENLTTAWIITIKGIYGSKLLADRKFKDKGHSQKCGKISQRNYEGLLKQWRGTYKEHIFQGDSLCHYCL